MSLFSFRKKESVADEVLILDIGSGSVGVALAEFREAEPAIVYADRMAFDALSMPSYEALSQEMQRVLALLLDKLAKRIIADKRRSLPDQAQCFLGSPWALSEARSVVYEKKNEFRVTSALLDNVRGLARAEAEKELADDVESTKQSFEVTFSEFSRTKLNGYLTRLPEGKSARSVELSGFVGMTARETRKQISAVIKRSFSHADVSFTPAPFAYYRAVEMIAIVPNDYVFFDIRSEVTDVLVVRDEELTHSGSFPFGSERALGALADSTLEARNLINLYYAKELSRPEEDRILKTLGSIQEEWTTYVDDFRASASAYGALPTTLLYASEVGSERFVKDLVLQKFTPAKQTHRVSVHIFDLPLVDAVDIQPSASFDPFLALSCLYLSGKR